ncbi:MAG: hypothetical protein FJ087_15740 [Deltaproteobacteria bacterium]|nr:hypothetical protein [Deltaproteobacteria bacterium]
MLDGRDRGRLVGGAVLVALGIVFLVDEMFDVQLLGTLWPLALVALGAYLLMDGRKGGGKGNPESGPGDGPANAPERKDGP